MGQWWKRRTLHTKFDLNLKLRPQNLRGWFLLDPSLPAKNMCWADELAGPSNRIYIFPDCPLIETSFTSLEVRVKDTQIKLLQTLLNDSSRSRHDDPFRAIWKLCKEEERNGFRRYNRILDTEHILKDMHAWHERVSKQQGTEHKTYVHFNETLSDHGVYTSNISEHYQYVSQRMILLTAS